MMRVANGGTQVQVRSRASVVRKVHGCSVQWPAVCRHGHL